MKTFQETTYKKIKMITKIIDFQKKAQKLLDVMTKKEEKVQTIVFSQESELDPGLHLEREEYWTLDFEGEVFNTEEY